MDSITIVIVLDFLHDNFETTTNNMLKSGDQLIDKIQQILVSVEAKFLSKKAIKITNDLVIMFKQTILGFNKKKAISKDKYFN